MNLNQNIFYFFYNLSHQAKFLDKLTVFIAETLPYIMVILALVFLSLFFKSFKKFLFVFFSSVFAWVCAYVLKLLFHTSRPFVALPDVTPLWVESGYAFPSGHATFFMALACAIYFSHKKAGYVFISFAFLIGLARIAAGVHFPIDILGGFVLGGGVAYLVNYWYKNR